MEKQNIVYLSFAALSLIGGIVMTTIDLRQANHITHSTALGYLLAALFVSLFLTNRRGMFKVTCCLGCILACILIFAEVLLILKSGSLGLRVFRILLDLLIYYSMWILFLKTPWDNMKSKHITSG